jgi:L,D-peptidoglycan transpeptidase YkuD (ErfK/YbiS/YcfS/YnhG family)
MEILVSATAPARGILRWDGVAVACSLGHGGVRRQKVEGDGATPAGRFALRRVLWRADRLARPATGLPVAAIREEDGWCDWPGDSLYNQQVSLPFAARHERLWRADGLYDVVVVIGHNDDPVVAGAGSAVFMHVAREDLGPTEGCVGLALPDLLRLLARCGPGSALEVAAPP